MIIMTLYRHMDLKITTQSFNNKNMNLTLKGFILNYNNNNYIITLHHNLGISEVCEVNTSILLDICINSCWNEVLIMKSQKIDMSKYIIYENIKNNIRRIV